MPNNSILGIHETALMIRSRRTEVLAANIANADTPNYKARDIDFVAAMRRAEKSVMGKVNVGTMAVTHNRHIQLSSPGMPNIALRYRNPLQSSLDNNTVDAQKEHAAFMDNALRYQASLRFINGRVKGLLTAIRGD